MPFPSTQDAMLSPKEAKEVLSVGNVLLVDVREPAEHAAGRIPGAKLVPLGTLPEAARDWNRDEPVVIYCRSGRRGETAREALAELGFTRLANIDGGFSAWTAAGLPGEKSRNAPWSLERQVRCAVGVFVIAFTGLGIGVSHWFFLLDFLISAGLIFSAVSNTCGLALVLARMPWNKVS